MLVLPTRRVMCVYLACKVEELNVSIAQFVGNVRGDWDKATDMDNNMIT